MGFYRVETEYKVRRVVYVEADGPAQAKQRVKDTAEWVEECDPAIVYESIVGKKATNADNE